MSARTSRDAVNIGVLVATALLGVWVVAVEPTLATSEERTKRMRHLFQDFARDELSAIELEPAGGARASVSRANAAATWELRIDGVATDGDELLVDKLAAAIEYATVLREAQTGTFGFEAPRLRGAVVVRGKRQEFLVGGEAPGAPGAAYARVGDGPAVVVSAAFVAEVLAPASRFYDRRVVPYLSLETARVELLRGGVLTAAASPTCPSSGCCGHTGKLSRRVTAPE